MHTRHTFRYQEIYRIQQPWCLSHISPYSLSPIDIVHSFWITSLRGLNRQTPAPTAHSLSKIARPLPTMQNHRSNFPLIIFKEESYLLSERIPKESFPKFPLASQIPFSSVCPLAYHSHPSEILRTSFYPDYPNMILKNSISVDFNSRIVKLFQEIPRIAKRNTTITIQENSRITSSCIWIAKRYRSHPFSIQSLLTSRVPYCAWGRKLGLRDISDVLNPNTKHIYIQSSPIYLHLSWSLSLSQHRTSALRSDINE